jgi:hypothetical protein
MKPSPFKTGLVFTPAPLLRGLAHERRQHHRPGRGCIVKGQENRAVVFDKGSGKWLKCTPDGGSRFVSDKAQASEIDPSQLEAYIRDYELEYLRYSLVTEPVARAADS